MVDKKPTVNVPDEDFDDLDDVLDQFNHDESPAGLVSPPPPPPTATTTTTFTRPRNNTRTDAPPISVPGSGANLDPMSEADEDQVSSEFAKELAKEMHTLVMQQLARGPDPVEGADSAERVRQFNEAWEAMLVEGLDGSTSSTGGAPPPNPFQNRLNQVVDKLRESEATLETESSTKTGTLPPDGAPESLESLESLLSSLRDLGPEDDAEFAGILESMMGQLMSKEVLYDPLNEMAQAFPPYLENPPSPINDEDRKRFELQLACVREILVIYNDPGYSDENLDTKNKLSDLMNKLQTYGSPPSEVMGPLPPGTTLGPDGLPEGCLIA